MRKGIYYAEEGSPMSRFISAKRRSEEASNQQLTSLWYLILAKSFYTNGKQLAPHLILMLTILYIVFSTV